MMDVKDIYVLLTANTAQFESKMAEAAGQTKLVHAGLSGLQATAIGAGVALAGVAVAVTGWAVEQAKNYQDVTDKLIANTGMAADKAEELGNAFLSTMGRSEFSAQQIMAAYAPVAGQLQTVTGHALSVAQAMQFMDTAQRLAEASGEDLGAATADLARLMQSYQIPLSDVAHSTDILFNASRDTATSLSAISGEMEKLHSKLGPLAPSLSDVSTLLLDIKLHGLDGGRALMQVSTGLNTLLGGSKATNVEVKALGLTLFDANGKFVGLSSILGQLSPKLATMTEEQRHFAEQALFGRNATEALDKTLLAGLPAWNKSSQAINQQGTVAHAAHNQQQSLDAQSKILQATITDLGINFGKVAIGPLTDFLRGLDMLFLGMETVAPYVEGVASVAFVFFGKVIDGATKPVQLFVAALNKLWELAQKLPDALAKVGKSMPLIGPLMGGTGGGGGGPLDFLGKVAESMMGIIPHAAGGSFAAGQSMLVGERGPEIVRFGSGGTVTPHVNTPTLSGGHSGGGQSITINGVTIIVKGVTDPDEVARKVRESLLNMGRGKGIPSLLGAYA